MLILVILSHKLHLLFFFFFQAEDGIRDIGVTGVQTCALPIFVFLDESGLDTRLTRPYARAPGGQRAVGRVPGGNWRRLTILGAIARDGLVAVMTVAAATSTAVFLAFIEGMLIPMLHARPGAMVVMDNLAPHKAAGVRTALRQAGLEHRYLPAYSPDLNPIEPCWSKLLLVQAQGRAPRGHAAQHRRPQHRLARRPRRHHA